MNSKIKKLMRQHPTFNPEFLPAADMTDTLEMLDAHMEAAQNTTPLVASQKC